MERKQFLNSASGRITMGTVGLLTLAAGLLALVGPGHYVTYFIPLVFASGVVGFIVALVLGVAEFPESVFPLIVTLPLLGGAYFAALNFLDHGGTILGVCLCLLGAASLTTAAFGVPSRRPEITAMRTSTLPLYRQHHRTA